MEDQKDMTEKKDQVACTDNCPKKTVQTSEAKLSQADYEAILSQELVAALGCTEPIAIALCTAKAGDLLREAAGDSLREAPGDLLREASSDLLRETPGDSQLTAEMIDRMELSLSSNVIKNAHSVYVPNSGGKKGIPFAAALGLLAGDASRGLEVLETADEKGCEEAERFLSQDKLQMEVAEGVCCLYVSCELEGLGHKVTATISGDHDRFVYLEKDGEVLLDLRSGETDEEDKVASLKARLKFPDIWEAQADGMVERSPKIQELLARQVACNSDIGAKGLNEAWGQEVGRNILATKTSPEDELIALAAAGSDARMAGCALPVVINSGSGNQGMTLSLPLIQQAKQDNKSQEELYRALFVANLTAVYIKSATGKLSAYCGAVSAAAACAAGMACLRGLSYQIAENTLINALSIASGLVCDGATGSCAAKIAVSLRSSLLALHMAEQGQVFPAGEGLGGSSLEVCVENIGRLAQNMVDTDLEIMNIIIEDK